MSRFFKSAFIGQSSYEHGKATINQAVLISNLGTPVAPTASALRTYLREFLSDPRLIELPRALWLLILYAIVLVVRPRLSAKRYQQVWTASGSPLLSISIELRDSLQKKLDSLYGQGSIPVVLGMRYGKPSIEEAIAQMAAMNVRKIITLPLYPQYCSATTASTFDAVAQCLGRYRWVPDLCFINGYHTDNSYIEAVTASILEYIRHHETPDLFLFSYHGTPKRNLELGDPYYCFCNQTTRLVQERLELDTNSCLTSFQSRFGRGQWLQPYTDKVLEGLPAKGIARVALVCPGFAVDCLETLGEIAQEAKAIFMASGGEQFDYIPCLNASPGHIDALTKVLQPILSPPS